MLRIGILGFGKMGQAINDLASEYDAHVVWRANRADFEKMSDEVLKSVDVVIEFTRPESAWPNIRRCLEAGVAVVSGTTGWIEKLEDANALCKEREGAMIWASNFSVGVNVLFALNHYLSSMMAQRPEYKPELVEIHHVQKRDAPSGTGVTLAQQIINLHPGISDWALSDSGSMDETKLPVHAIREGEVKGTHKVLWTSAIDTISIAHEAHSREGFARGALLAAAWLKGKKGVFTMADVLGFQTNV